MHPDQIKDLFLYCDITVGSNDDGPGKSLRFRKRECPFKYRQQPGSASAPLALDQMNGLAAIFRACRQRRFRHHGGAACEEKNVEPILGTQPTDEIL